MRLERLAGDRSIAGHGGLDREALIALDLEHELPLVIGQRRNGQGMRPVAVDPRRHLDHVHRLEVRHRALIPDVDHLHVAAAVVQRGDELCRGLAVIGTAAVVEERRLPVELRVPVQFEELALDLHHFGGTRLAALLLVTQHLVEPIEVAQVVRGQDAGSLQLLQRHAQVVRQELAVAGDQVRQAIHAVHARRALPAEVVQPNVLKCDAIRIHAEPAGDHALQRDRHVAQANRPVLAVQERLADDTYRVGEVDDPGAVRRTGPGQLGELENQGDGTQRLGEAARAGRLLADGAELRGEGLVDQSGGLPADSELDEHEIGTVHGGVAVEGGHQPPAPAGSRQHALRQAPDHFEPLRLDIEQDQLVDGEPVGTPGEPIHELRRVGAAAADHRDLGAHRSLKAPLTWRISGVGCLTDCL